MRGGGDWSAGEAEIGHAPSLIGMPFAIRDIAAVYGVWKLGFQATGCGKVW